MMDCKYCRYPCKRAGRQKNGLQRYYCRICKKYQQKEYIYPACAGNINPMMRLLIVESVGIRGISRVLRISTGAVLRRIKLLASRTKKPALREEHPIFEVDELWTYIGQKENEYWLAYGLDRKTKEVVDFVIGKRTKKTLKILIDRLLGLSPKRIYTDKLTIYQRLIPSGLHRAAAHCINHIERKNLSIRTHLKRLSRRTICFS